LAFSLLIAGLCGTSLASAQSDAGSRALAVQLFDEAEALFEKEQLAQACPKYAESYRLDPQLGVLVYLAECYEKNGQVASAWGSFREAEEIARKRGDARGEHARERARALEPRLSYLTIEVPEPVRVPGLEVLRGGVPVAAVLWNARAAVDAGTHQIDVRASGYEPWRGSVVVSGEGGSATLRVPKLTPLPAGASGSGAALGPRDAPAAQGTSRRIAAIAVGGLGLVGVGVGGFFGLSAQSSLSEAKGLCNENDYCTPRGDTLRSSAKSKALVATVATGVGAAALVTAAVLWFTAPKAEAGIASRPAPPRQAWTVAPAAGAWGMEVSRAF
jgi:serine/threonine-protein kinase